MSDVFNPVLFHGIIHVTGEPDAGKTMFAFSSGAMPENTAFIDDDIKGVMTVEQINEQGHKLGYYRNLFSEGEGLKEISFHKKCLEIIDELIVASEERGSKFDVLIWDTWTRFENTFHPYVNMNPTQFRSRWSPKGDIKGAEEWKESFNYEASILNRLQKAAKLIILTTHLKPENIAGRRTGKMIPDCKLPLAQKTLLRAYLRHNPDGPEPIGLILKRISRQKVTDHGIQIVSVLPRKMKPFTWLEIRRYWEDPVGNRPLTSDEMPDEYELSILDGTLTEDQKMIMRLHDIPPLNSDEEESNGNSTEKDENGIIAKVFELKDEGKSNPLIAKALEISVKDVNRILKTR